jgi:hypothetical protein
MNQIPNKAYVVFFFGGGLGTQDPGPKARRATPQFQHPPPPPCSHAHAPARSAQQAAIRNKCQQVVGVGGALPLLAVARDLDRTQGLGWGWGSLIAASWLATSQFPVASTCLPAQLLLTLLFSLLSRLAPYAFAISPQLPGPRPRPMPRLATSTATCHC